MASRASIDIADALHSAAIHLLRRARKEDELAGIGPARLSALSVLVFAGPMRLTDLARIEQVRPPTMSKVVAGLVTAGLVRRRLDDKDARAAALEPTPRGRRLLQEGRRRRVDRIAAAIQELSADEADVVARAAPLIERLATRMP